MNATKHLSQSLRLLELIKASGLTTLDARRIGIMNPAQRVSELCKRGYPIDTIKIWQRDEHGHMHRVAMYVWNPQQKRQSELWT